LSAARSPWIALGAAALVGCAARPPVPALVDARVAIGAARSSPYAGKALDELREAEDALDRAEASSASARGDAVADAYVARRKAERAAIAGQIAADLELLGQAREEVGRLRAAVDRLEAERAARRKRDREDAIARRRGLEALQGDLERACGEGADLHVEAEGPVLEIAAKYLFKPGLTELSERGEQRFAAILAAVRAAPLVRVAIVVTDSSGGVGANAGALARRRAARLRDAFVEQGVPPDLVTAEGREGEARHVHLGFVEERAAPLEAARAREPEAAPKP
jgi:outer membrane protein OmpA-like peptidoglycan-associated protein